MTANSRRAQRYEQKAAQARRKKLIGIGIVLALVVIGVIVAVVSMSSDDEATFDGAVVNLVLGDYVIQGDLTAPAGPVRLHAVNEGGMRHNVGIRRGPISGDIAPGQSLDLDIKKLNPGTYELYCDLPQHVEKGMVAKLTITEAVTTDSTSEE